MRILLTTRGSSGHVLPLAPFGRAALAAGHEVLVAAQRRHGANVSRTGLGFAPTDDPPREEWVPLLSTFSRLGVDEANAAMVGEYFARIDTEAALPGLEAIVEDFAPDVIIRDSWEFTSTLVAEPRGIPVVRVALGLADVEALTLRLVAPALDTLRARLGLPADPGADRLRDSEYFTTMPYALEDPAEPLALAAWRFGLELGRDAAPLPDWWPNSDDPLVYLTLGTVAGEAHLPYFPALYRSAIEALAPLPIRLLVTVGDEPDLALLGPLPSNVHVEPWVAQDAVARHADVIVCHGGYGSTLGALAHGVPLVVLPLFSIDQWANAGAVERCGAGVALTAERDTRRVLDLPSAATVDALAPAVRRVLGDRDFRYRAMDIAEAIRTQPPVAGAVDALAGIAQAAALR
jgi:UDP:flavonoid glycosyltransferase YjiC (YdhE family)